eukprot:CAMPEP_0201203878 /NCGR_PEP_ID=MMETSP0851-20130426/167849_1 /ASSEMBLY_ACC=CAM_ASM_000631 /TAXON_ID=183588 /ORGANISM="Pseudo-nitzschia fraudulenta, Strain WWA7" /LENGTH=270 /DNA_ID=CAMNT_0047491911 /DNA_START=48 /DNA_END=857 /DNA_ORIENTATION=-
MKLICMLCLARQIINLVGNHASFAFTVETQTFQHRYRKALPGFKDVRRRSSKSLGRTHSKTEEYDDGIGDWNDDRNTDSDGAELAADFFKSLEKRKEATTDAGMLASDSGTTSSQPTNAAEREPSSTPSSAPPARRGDVRGGLFETKNYYDEKEKENNNNPPKPPTRKFTGRPVGGNDYFGSPDRGDSGNTVRNEMMRREYQLVSGATGKTAFAVQVGLALTMLVFFIYVGLTGGIVSGEEAVNMDYGGDEFIQFEQIIPVPRDSENSVW